MNIMTKRGSQDNVVTYEHICDTTADMQTIDPHYITLGSVCIVVSGESGGLEAYIADSQKQWAPLAINNVGNDTETGNLSIHLCNSSETDENGLPDVELPDENTLYLVPTSDENDNNLYNEYIYVNGSYELFGSGGSAISGGQSNWEQNNPEASDYIANRPGGYTLVEEGEYSIYSQTTITPQDGYFDLYSQCLIDDFEITDEEYILRIDDKEYEATGSPEGDSIDFTDADIYVAFMPSSQTFYTYNTSDIAFAGAENEPHTIELLKTHMSQVIPFNSKYINVHPDWRENDESSRNYIAHRPGGYFNFSTTRATILDQDVEVYYDSVSHSYKISTEPVFLLDTTKVLLGTEDDMHYLYISKDGTGRSYDASCSTSGAENEYWLVTIPEGFSIRCSNTPLSYNFDISPTCTLFTEGTYHITWQGRFYAPVPISEKFIDLNWNTTSSISNKIELYKGGGSNSIVQKVNESTKNNASGNNSFAIGQFTSATGNNQFIFGKNNIPDTVDSNQEGTYVEIVGNGEANALSNARTLDWNGNEWLAGNLTLNQTTLTESKLQYLNSINVESAVNTIASKTVTLSGTDLIVNAEANTRYICGELSTLSFTPVASGICDILFTSGSSKTILTLPNTVKMPDWFEVEANMIYEISIMDGIYGVVTSWAV